ncbi:MAG: IS3 family transposase [Firmicutes bacterium]|nr:IS3 family transposase [Bacillota bacterium]
MEQKQKRDEKELDYTTAIKKIFKEKDSTYGVDRICGCLRKCGYTASYQRVKRIMDNMGLMSIHRRRRQRSLTDSRKSKGLDLPNLVHNLNITEPFQVMPSDISYVRTAQGFDYLCSRHFI